MQHLVTHSQRCMYAFVLQKDALSVFRQTELGTYYFSFTSYFFPPPLRSIRLLEPRRDRDQTVPLLD